MKYPFLIVAISGFFAIGTAKAETLFITAEGQSVEFLTEKTIETGTYSLKIAAPDGRIWKEIYSGVEIPRVDLKSIFAGVLPDGQYHYEILPHQSQTATKTAPELRGLEPQTTAPTSAHTGTFTVINSQVVDPNQHEPSPAQPPFSKFIQSETTTSDDDSGETRDFVINDDLIVLGSTCIGFDCVNGETFSFDTLKLKENNTRLTFIDTSTVSGFPAGSWQLRANDSASGGADHFSIDWLGTSANVGNNPLSTPFRVDANAPTNSLRVSSIGRVGLRTSSPVLDLHIATSNTPGHRLEQTSAGGFTAQTWDIAGNEANFFVRDATNGSRLPFRIRPGAPTSSIDIAASGNVGIGTASPSSKLSVGGNDAGFRVANSSTTEAGRTLVRLQNNGFINFIMENVGTETWVFSAQEGRFTINSNQLSGAINAQFFTTGNLTLAGTLTENSSRSVKHDITPLDGTDILGKISNLEVSEWRYNTNPDSRHVGPMAEDWYELFGLGENGKGVAPRDLAGVALVAAKALYEENQVLKRRLDALEQKRD